MPSLFAKLKSGVRSFRYVIVAIAGVGAVLGGLAGYWNAYQTARGVVQGSLLSVVGTLDAGPISIVVLPFNNFTGDPRQSYIADGLTAAVTADLSRIRDAFVVSAATAFAYKDKAIGVRQLGRELGVRFVLQGGVQRDGDSILITAQLADTKNGSQLWAETFAGSQMKLFALQDMVTTRIGASIGQETVKVAARESETRANTPKVIDLMLRARAIDLTRNPSASAVQEEISLYRQALALDRGNIEVMISLAGMLAHSADNGFAADLAQKESQLLESRELALQAKVMAPSDARVFGVLAIYASAHGDFEGARRANERALALEPKSPGRYTNLADDYLDAGMPEKAIELLDRAIRLDPRNVSWATLGNMGRAQLMIGNDDDAIQWLLKASDASPDLVETNAYLAAAYARQKNPERARAAADAVLRINPKFRLSQFEPPKAGYPVAYRDFWQRTLLPAGRLAGLPE